MLGTKFSGNTNSTTFMSTPSVNHTINDFGGNHNTSSSCPVKLSLSPHKSSHGTFSTHTVDLFKIPDVN